MAVVRVVGVGQGQQGVNMGHGWGKDGGASTPGVGGPRVSTSMQGWGSMRGSMGGGGTLTPGVAWVAVCGVGGSGMLTPGVGGVDAGPVSTLGMGGVRAVWVGSVDAWPQWGKGGRAWLREEGGVGVHVVVVGWLLGHSRVTGVLAKHGPRSSTI
ncbi:hypothetical protein K439DRAFT_1623523 [Ramaria rubella]|nr:hypothetical protein K439DRAFT_1623523 [Ramaria rubella]